MLNKKQREIIEFVRANQPVKREAIHKGINSILKVCLAFRSSGNKL